jgi:tRNA threonylcarbamoyladenosine biosynthesis protein TsaE
MASSVTTHFTTHSPEETIEFGRRIAALLKPPILVLLLGDLGAGKTTLTKGIIDGLGVAPVEEVTSPTFTLIHEYGNSQRPGPRVYHIDLYRIEDAADLMTLGLEDMLAENAILLVEWGERLGSALRDACPGSRTLEIHISSPSEHQRQFELREG